MQVAIVLGFPIALLLIAAFMTLKLKSSESKYMLWIILGAVILLMAISKTAGLHIFLNDTQSEFSPLNKKIYDLFLLFVLTITIIMLLSIFKAMNQSYRALKNSEEKFRYLFDNQIDAVYLIEPDNLKIINCNRKAVEMTGYTIDELRNFPFADLHPKMERNNVQHILGKIAEDKMDQATFVLHHRKNHGSIIIIEMNTGLMHLNGEKTIKIVTRDITEHKLKEDKISLFFKATENSLEAIGLSDLDKRLIYVNNAFEVMFGYPRDELIGKKIDILYPDDTYRKLLKSVQINEEGGWIGELTGRKKDGSLFSLLVSSSIILNDDKTIIARMTTHRDITEKKLAEEKMIAYTDQLRSLSDHLTTIREEERLTLSREIHDGLGSSLTGLKMDLTMLKRNILECCSNKPVNEIINNIKSMTELIDTTFGLMRRIVRELRPEFLDELGLGEAIRWYVSEFEKRTNIKFRATVFPKDIVTDKKRSITIFRIFQEILINIAHHSKATEVTVFLRKKKETISLLVHDNGIGINKEDINNIKSFGILGMQERTLIFGGKLQIEGIEGHGTTIKLDIPIN